MLLKVKMSHINQLVSCPISISLEYIMKPVPFLALVYNIGLDTKDLNQKTYF